MKTTASKGSILVLETALRSGPWACRSLAQAGYRVIAANQHGRWLAGRSTYALRVVRYPSPWRDPAAFLARVEELCRRESVDAVLPLSETAVHLLAKDLPEPARAVVVAPTFAQYEQVCDKGALRDTAARAEVDVPSEVIVGADGPNGEWPALPSIVKPRASATPTKGKVLYRTATVVRTPAEREAAVASLVAEMGGAVVQEEVRGLRWLVEFVRSSRGLATLPRLILRSYPPRTGSSSVSKTIEAPPELTNATRRLLDVVGYEGPGSIGFLVQNGRFLVHDVNLRLPFSVGATIGSGLDLPRLAVEAALDLDIPLEIGPVRRHTYVWFAGECKAFTDAVRGREAAAPPARIAAGVVAAAVSPRRLLDPPFTEPLPLAALAAAAVTSGANRVARALVHKAPSTALAPPEGG